jgi:hypothetical protein
MTTYISDALHRIVSNTELVSGAKVGDEDAALILNEMAAAGFLICPEAWFTWQQREESLVFKGKNERVNPATGEIGEAA